LRVRDRHCIIAASRRSSSSIVTVFRLILAIGHRSRPGADPALVLVADQRLGGAGRNGGRLPRRVRTSIVNPIYNLQIADFGVRIIVTAGVTQRSGCRSCC
jgi:hypothetical protein